jgi:hypothetical protein
LGDEKVLNEQIVEILFHQVVHPEAEADVSKHDYGY